MTPRRALLRWPALLAFMALSIAGAQEQTARLVKDANQQPDGYGAGIGWMMPVGKQVVFPMDTFAHGYEVWTSDGTPRGTRLLKEIAPGPAGFHPSFPTPFGERAGAKMAFSRWEQTSGGELWVTDGTEAGTMRIFQNPVSSSGSDVTPRAGTTSGLFFECPGQGLDHTPDLLFSDGTAEGTRVLNPAQGGNRLRFSDPRNYTTRGQWCYFTANANEIWRSDGTEAGTTKVNTLPSGLPDRLALTGECIFVQLNTSAGFELWSYPLDGGEPTRVGPPEGTQWSSLPKMAALGGELFFLNDDGSKADLWASDGTVAGTRQIPLLQDGGTASQTMGDMREWNGAIYIEALGNDGRYELWRTDGTPAGTIRLESFSQPETYFSLSEAQATADSLFFPVRRQDDEWVLWQTNGDATTTRRVRGTQPFNPGPMKLAATESTVYFVNGYGTPDEALWRTRGKSGNAVRLTRPEKTTQSGIDTFTDQFFNEVLPFESTPYEMTGKNLVAFIKTGDEADELWRMNPDGTRARAIWKPSNPLREYGALAFHGTTASGAIFTYSDGADVRQVWVTNGTRPGTKLLADHSATADNTYPHDFVKVGDVWFYSALGWPSYNSSPSSLWKTDGTRAGTSKVLATDGSSPEVQSYHLVAFQGSVWFPAIGANGKSGLWRSDGTPAGTVMVKDTWHGQDGERLVGLSVVGEKLIFSVQLADSQVLWQSDGTAAGTVAVSSNNYFLRWGVDRPADLGGVAIFPAEKKGNYIGQFHEQLWCYDDANGLRPLQIPTPGDLSVSLYPWEQRHAVVGTRMFYSGLPNLSVTDGTSGGTHEFPVAYAPQDLLAVGSAVYFSAYDEEHGRELWRSDGTAEGTVLVADINPGSADSDPQGLKVMDGKLYFNAIRRDVGRELFVIDLPK